MPLVQLRNKTVSKNIITRNVTAAMAGFVLALGLAAAGPASASVGSCTVNTTPKSLEQDAWSTDASIPGARPAQCPPTQQQKTSHTFANTKDVVPGTTKTRGKL
jgi:hypothetical protein